MIFHAANNTLTPADNAARRYMDGREGTVDLLPVSASKRRSLDANAKYWAWCHQVEQAQGWQPGDAHRYAKWSWGLAILTRKHPEYRDRLLSMLRDLPYEQRLEAMDLIAATSQFTTAEMSEYMDAVQTHWARQGVVLE